MYTLDFDDLDNQTPRKRKALRVILGIGALTGVIALGSTLAANINLNGGGTVEFGQGIAETVSCQKAPLIITPRDTFKNSTNEFVLSGLKIANFEWGCVSNFFKVSIWPVSGSEPLFNFLVFDPTGPWMTGGIYTDTYRVGNTLTLGNNGADFIDISTLSSGNFDETGLNNIPAASIGRITIESSASEPTLSREVQSLDPILFDNTRSRGDSPFVSANGNFLVNYFSAPTGRMISKIVMSTLEPSDLSGGNPVIYALDGTSSSPTQPSIGQLNYSAATSSDNSAVFIGNLTIPEGKEFWLGIWTPDGSLISLAGDSSLTTNTSDTNWSQSNADYFARSASGTFELNGYFSFIMTIYGK